MSQPTQTEAALEEFRKAGVPIERVPRLYYSQKMKGRNAEIYATWISRWARNAVANYPIITRAAGVSFLDNAAKDIPAIVVGIGPSLDAEIETLKKAPRHAIIIATDAALRVLLSAGIEPDIVVNFDGRHEQSTLWETIDTKPYVLLANTVTSPKTIEAWDGKVMFFNMMQSDDEFASNILPILYPQLGTLPNMGTVGNGAVYLAYLMGCTPILTVGMEYCFASVMEWGDIDPEQRALVGWRYRCTDYHNINGEWLPIENKTLYDNDDRVNASTMEEINGRQYRTDDCLKYYREALLRCVGQLDLPLINCSAGVLENFVQSMPLSKALDLKCRGVLEPGRTVVKYLKRILGPNPKHGWHLDPRGVWMGKDL